MRRPGLDRVRRSYWRPVDNCGTAGLCSPGMEPHHHVWVRVGRSFMLKTKAYETRSAAHKAAAKLRNDAADRMVRSCVDCPKSTPSRRRNQWGSIAKRLAEVLELDAAVVRHALDAARRFRG